MKKYRSQATPNVHIKTFPVFEKFCMVWLCITCAWLMYLVSQVADPLVCMQLIGGVCFCLGIAHRGFAMEKTDRARIHRVAVLVLLTACGASLVIVLDANASGAISDNVLPAALMVVMPGFLVWSTRWI